MQGVVPVEPAPRAVVLHLVDDNGTGRVGIAGRILLQHRSGHVGDGLLGGSVIQPELPAVRPPCVERLEHVVGFTRRDNRPPEVGFLEPLPHPSGVLVVDPVRNRMRGRPELVWPQAEAREDFRGLAALRFRTRPHNHMAALRRPLLGFRRLNTIFGGRRRSLVVRISSVAMLIVEIGRGESLKHGIAGETTSCCAQQPSVGRTRNGPGVEIGEDLTPPLFRVAALKNRSVCKWEVNLVEHGGGGSLRRIDRRELISEVIPVVPIQADVGAVVRDPVARRPAAVANRCHWNPPPPQRRRRNGCPSCAVT